MIRTPLPLLFLTACAQPIGASPVADIYWSDGDSGRVDGVRFRLADVDAPETGAVGARGGAKCEGERALGYDAKAFMIELTRGAALETVSDDAPDRYGRVVITLLVDGQDAAATGVDAGHLAPWPHDGHTALADKPDWCG